MKTNIFKVKEKKQKKIIIEEEVTKNRLLIFLKRNKNFILLSLILLVICISLIGAGLAFSIFQASTEIDVSFLDDKKDVIDTNNDPNIDDDTVAEELLGEISRKEGVVILSETFMNDNGDVIYCFSDKSSIIILASGKIYRVASLDNGEYGIDKNGNINPKAKKILVKSTTSTLINGAVVTYYSDGTAKIEHNNIILFVRDSTKIKLNSGNSFVNITPSGVATAQKNKKKDNLTASQFTDNTMEVINNNNKYIVNRKSDITLTDTEIKYDINNSFPSISEKKLTDNNTITYYSNGSAVITDSNNNKIYVKKSGDITIKNNKIYEIIPNDFGYSKGIVNSSDGKKVTYFDNGAAIIAHPDGSNQYIEDSDDIIYDSSKNITTNPTSLKQISIKKTPDGKVVINFDNGKSQIINSDGTSYITDTSKVIFSSEGNVEEPPKLPSLPSDNNEEGNEDGTGSGGNGNITEGIFVSEAEHRYNYSKSVENSNFLIKNTTNEQKKYRIVIEEISNYQTYNTSRLDPKFVNFQATIEDEFVPATKLNNNIWNDENGKINYVIYDGTLKAKSTIEVALSLYVDYSKLDNSYQNKAFIGTIKVYVNSEDK